MKAVDKFIGMFAIAVWNERERRLLLLRDRMGVKPLYYAWDGTHFWFGSELKALRAFRAMEARDRPRRARRIPAVRLHLRAALDLSRRAQAPARPLARAGRGGRAGRAPLLDAARRPSRTLTGSRGRARAPPRAPAGRRVPLSHGLGRAGGRVPLRRPRLVARDGAPAALRRRRDPHLHHRLRRPALRRVALREAGRGAPGHAPHREDRHRQRHAAACWASGPSSSTSRSATSPACRPTSSRRWRAST